MEYYFAVLLFSAACGFTPGPNNLMLMTSGLNHGVKKTIPHYFGVILGYGMMLAILGAGLASVFLNYPAIHLTLKYVGVCYILFLAWKIANAGNPDANQELRAPLTFIQGALFQWLNPKGILFAIGSIAAFTSPETMLENLVFIVFANIFIGSMSAATWLMLGTALQKLIQSPKQVMYFNFAMAFFLILSIIPILTMQVGSN